nr:hypothetical protein GCM10020093_003930 [Planobispora longispora]
MPGDRRFYADVEGAVTVDAEAVHVLPAELEGRGDRGIRWGRTSRGMASWTAAKATKVRAMAGRVRRTSIPTVTPRAKAKAAYPRGRSRAR